MLGASAPLGAAHLQNLAYLGDDGYVYSVDPQLMNLGWFDGIVNGVKDSLHKSKWIDQKALKAVEDKVDEMKHDSDDALKKTADAVASATHLVDWDKIKKDTDKTLHKIDKAVKKAGDKWVHDTEEAGKKFVHDAEKVGEVALKVGEKAAEVGGTLAAKGTNFIMSDQGQSIITNGISDSIALGTAIASGNVVGGIIDGVKLAKGGIEGTAALLAAPTDLGSGGDQTADDSAQVADTDASA